MAIETPEILLSYPGVVPRYREATFERDVAMRRRNVQLLGLGHPLVDSVIRHLQRPQQAGDVCHLGNGAQEARCISVRALFHLELERGRKRSVYMNLFLTPDGSWEEGPPRFDVDLLAQHRTHSREVVTGRTLEGLQLIADMPSMPWARAFAHPSRGWSASATRLLVSRTLHEGIRWLAWTGGSNKVKPRTSPIVKVEDIMTPRSAFVTIEPDGIKEAPLLARENDFEVVPIMDGGHIRTFWRRKTRRVHAITERHRIQYFADVGSILGRLVSREAQFVCYGDEVVGLVDLSDLNKPMARLVWLHPILELEHAIFSQMFRRGISDEIVRQALGSSAKNAEKRQTKARKEDLSLPLVAFLQFPQVLQAAQRLEIMPVTADEIRILNEVRRRSAHGVARPVEQITDGRQLVRAIQICMRLIHGVQ